MKGRLKYQTSNIQIFKEIEDFWRINFVMQVRNATGRSEMILSTGKVLN